MVAGIVVEPAILVVLAVVVGIVLVAFRRCCYTDVVILVARFAVRAATGAAVEIIPQRHSLRVVELYSCAVTQSVVIIHCYSCSLKLQWQQKKRGKRKAKRTKSCDSCYNSVVAA